MPDTPGTPPRKRWAGKIVLIVLAIVFVPGIVLSIVRGVQGSDSAPEPKPQEQVVDNADGCRRF
jgi:hypothetical protein